MTFTLGREEIGIRHAVHQAHLVSLHGSRIDRDRAWCCGRWPAALRDELAEAARD
jgi:hypothetical protein